MAGQNQVLEKPPTTSDILDNLNSKKGNTSWLLWFDKLHYLLTPVRNQQNITSAQGINLDANYVSLSNSSGSSYAVTLDPPTAEARDMLIEMIAGDATNFVTLALTNCTGGTASTQCKWNSTNQQLLLKSAHSKWVIYKQNGVTLT